MINRTAVHSEIYMNRSGNDKFTQTDYAQSCRCKITSLPQSCYRWAGNFDSPVALRITS
uniref:Uncharacterized protein n=1 Tax=Arundo donax TaxID=35708 RepID=A0A0A9FFA0_ARUDO